MYLRITNTRFDPSRYDEVVRLGQEASAALVRLPGYQHHHMGIDRNAGTSAVVSVWDTEEHARYSRDVLGDVVGRLQAEGVQFDPPNIYEIVA